MPPGALGKVARSVREGILAPLEAVSLAPLREPEPGGLPGGSDGGGSDGAGQDSWAGEAAGFSDSAENPNAGGGPSAAAAPGTEGAASPGDAPTAQPPSGAPAPSPPFLATPGASPSASARAPATPGSLSAPSPSHSGGGSTPATASTPGAAWRSAPSPRSTRSDDSSGPGPSGPADCQVSLTVVDSLGFTLELTEAHRDMRWKSSEAEIESRGAWRRALGEEAGGTGRDEKVDGWGGGEVPGLAGGGRARGGAGIPQGSPEVPEAPESWNPGPASLPSRYKLKKLCRLGCPPELRFAVWQECTGARARREQYAGSYYQGAAEMGRLGSPFARQIDLDVPRTFPACAWLQSDQGRASLRRVLMALAFHNPALGYCQGLNYVAGMLLRALVSGQTGGGGATPAGAGADGQVELGGASPAAGRPDRGQRGPPLADPSPSPSRAAPAASPGPSPPPSSRPSPGPSASSSPSPASYGGSRGPRVGPRASGVDDSRGGDSAGARVGEELGQLRAAPAPALVPPRVLAECEAASFWILASLVDPEDGILYRGTYTRDLSGAHVEMRALAELMAKKLPRLSRHLSTLGCEPSLLATDWFLCLFATSLPPETACRVWDSLFCEGSKVLFRFSLALLRRAEGALLAVQDAGEALRAVKACAAATHDRDRLAREAFGSIGGLPMRSIARFRQSHQARVDAETAARETRAALRRAVAAGYVVTEAEAELVGGGVEVTGTGGARVRPPGSPGGGGGAEGAAGDPSRASVTGDDNGDGDGASGGGGGDRPAAPLSPNPRGIDPPPPEGPLEVAFRRSLSARSHSEYGDSPRAPSGPTPSILALRAALDNASGDEDEGQGGRGGGAPRAGSPDRTSASAASASSWVRRVGGRTFDRIAVGSKTIFRKRGGGAGP